MNIVWLCNVPLPEMAQTIGIKSYSAGWLIGISSELRKQNNVNLSIIFPQNRIKKLIEKSINGITYYGVYKKNICEYDKELNTQCIFKKIITKEKPDIIPIFGTEYPHSLEMLEVSSLNKVVISIQGLVSVICKHYLQGISYCDIMRPVIYEGRIQSLYTELDGFKKLGHYEKKIFKKCKYVIGRTDWDYACVKEINKNINYFKCNETMRNLFYEKQWKYDEIDKFSIFVSQGSYSVKGLHYLLEAMPIIKNRFPRAHIYVAGDLEFRSNKYCSPYGEYINRLIKKMNIEDNITFVGYHTEKQMCKRYLKSHVSVMCSNIENSPNSIGEAMLLGIPVVASYVGGIPNLLEHNKEGFLYQHNAPYMLSHYIMKIFSDEELAKRLAENARNKAVKLYNRETNNNILMNIYKTISNKY